jgi:MarR family 2-MHQ and catechol resistance regulon transcriptional repressor
MPTHYSGSPQQVLALDTFIKLTRAANSLQTRIFQGESFEGLTHSQFSVLEVLFHLGPLSQGELSTRLLKSTGNMTLVLDNLEKRGLVRREREREDRRVVTLHLTPTGELTIRRIFPQVAAAITAQFTALTPEEQGTLAQLCKKLGKGLR